jgi:hypothetical protein
MTAVAVPRAGLLNGVAVRVIGANHHVDLRQRRERSGHRLDGHDGGARRVSAAERHEQAAHVAGAGRCLGTRRAKLAAQQGELRTEQQLAPGRHAAGIAGRGLRMQVLIEQHVAVVRAVGQVVDDEQPGRGGPQRRLPARVERVVIDHQPVAARRPQRTRGVGGIGGLRGRQPAGMRQIAASRSAGRAGRGVSRAYVEHLVAPLGDQRREVPRQRTADERHRGTPAPQPVGKAEAAHHVTGTHDRRRIGAHRHSHTRVSAPNACRTGMPAACMAAFAPAGVCSVKWNMLAAATADAPACCTASTRC